MGYVSGKVVFDGKPWTEGRIVFTSTELGAGGYSNLDGQGGYKVPGELPAGEYKVHIAQQDLGDAPPSEDGNPELKGSLSGLPKKFQDGATSGLSAKIEVGSNVRDFELKP